jgi:hypothetical protein
MSRTSPCVAPTCLLSQVRNVCGNVSMRARCPDDRGKCAKHPEQLEHFGVSGGGGMHKVDDVTLGCQPKLTARVSGHIRGGGWAARTDLLVGHGPQEALVAAARDGICDG